MSFKQLTLALAALTTAAVGEARCFTFVNGQGPSQLASITLAAPAQKMCIERTNALTGDQQDQLTLTDAQGLLAIFAASVSLGRCGDCTALGADLSYGNANGQNVDATGVRVQIKGQFNSTLGIEQGVVSVNSGGGQTVDYPYIAQ